MKQEKLKNSLRAQILKVTLVPLILMTIIIVAISSSTLYRAMVQQVQEEMQKDADLIVMLYDEIFTGDFSVGTDEDGTEILIYKGDRKITGEDEAFEELAHILNIDISLFYQDTRILTTLRNADGKTAAGTKAAAVVKRDVIENGEPTFYSDVTVYDNESFAYYKPLYAADGTVFGMVGVCRSSAEVRSDARNHIWPIVLAVAIMAVIVALITVWYIRKITDRIASINKFMNSMANGDFDITMPADISSKDDEIKKLANDGKQMARSIKKLVEYDALTDIANRRYAEKQLLEVKTRCQNNGMHFCVCIGDIDFFKKVNDTYGHEMGDEILKQVAAKLKAGIHGHGMVARWGGEEFLLIFYEMDMAEAGKLLESILDSIRTIYVPNTDRQITMSFGLTQADNWESRDLTVKRADDNLYEAKASGRNQIIAK